MMEISCLAFGEFISNKRRGGCGKSKDLTPGSPFLEDIKSEDLTPNLPQVVKCVGLTPLFFFRGPLITKAPEGLSYER